MQHLKSELNKILPLALFCGAIGGILLIIVSNLLNPSMISILVSYGLIIGLSVYVLNRLRFENEMKGSVLYGYIVYLVMTGIAYIDTIMNTQADFVNPIFENVAFFIAILAAVLFFSGSTALLFKRKVLQ